MGLLEAVPILIHTWVVLTQDIVVIHSTDNCHLSSGSSTPQLTSFAVSRPTLRLFNKNVHFQNLIIMYNSIQNGN